MLWIAERPSEPENSKESAKDCDTVRSRNRSNKQKFKARVAMKVESSRSREGGGEIALHEDVDMV